jgi:quinol monooxygenase YgiN
MDVVRRSRVLIVGGSFELDPDQREEFMASRYDSVKKSRSEPGCLEYTLAADPIEPGRVVLYERWEDQAALDAHIAGMREAAASQASSVAPKSASLTIYDIAGERSLGG